jgi:hypothetical protein
MNARKSTATASDTEDTETQRIQRQREQRGLSVGDDSFERLLKPVLRVLCVSVLSVLKEVS